MVSSERRQMLMKHFIAGFFSVSVIVFQLQSTSFAQSVRVIEWNRGKSTVALLFLHGIGGCAVPKNQTAAQACAPGTEDSFRNPTARKSWPEIVADDHRSLATVALSRILRSPMHMSDLGIWGIDYSRLASAGCANFSIPQAARLIRAQVESSRLFERYEQVIILAHSMGGLITKNMF